ncbi:hypothetical protein AB0A60_21390 [Streptomyces sp. NPDC046275]|uniref:hypothetical protein n=1 Tax=Streptomyces sp. NPDC046275 TaxID=3157201 RepID=UPI003410D810
MNPEEAEDIAQEFIDSQFPGLFLVAPPVVRRRGKFYAPYTLKVGGEGGASVGGNMPIEVDPESGKCRVISVGEFFDLDLNV